MYIKDSLEYDDDIYGNLNKSDGNIELQWVVTRREHTKPILAARCQCISCISCIRIAI